MRIITGVLLATVGVSFGAIVHQLPENDALSHLVQLTALVTAPPAATTAYTAADTAYTAADTATAGSRPATAGSRPATAGSRPATAGSPRVFSPDRPLFAVPVPIPAVRPARPVTTQDSNSTRGELRTTADTTPNALPRREPRAVDAVTRPLTVLPTEARRPAGLEQGDDARVALIRDLQRELKRVDCYHDDVDGSWGPGSKRAMADFTERVNATLPVEQPDFILLTLVQGHAGKACGAAQRSIEARAPAQQLLTQPTSNWATSTITTGAIAAGAARAEAIPAPVPVPLPARRVAKVTGSSAPFPAAAPSPRYAAAQPPQTQPASPAASNGWRTEVAAAPPLPGRPGRTQEVTVHGTTVAADVTRSTTPLQGRMGVGVTPAPDPAPAVSAPPPVAARRALERAERESREWERAASERRRRVAEARADRAERQARPRPRSSQPSYGSRRSTSFKRPGAVRDFFFSPNRSF